MLPRRLRPCSLAYSLAYSLTWTLAPFVSCAAISHAAGCSSAPESKSESKSESSPAQQGGAGQLAAGSVAGGAGGAGDVALCSGCPSDVRDAGDHQVRVHHVHLNVKDAEQAIAFYGKFFGTERVWLNDKAHALWADPLLLLLEEGDFELSEELRFGFEHVGLGVPDVLGWFEMAAAEGLTADTRNGGPAAPLSFPIPPGSSPFVDPEVGDFSFVYVRGPNGERIEVWSGLLQFRHAHFIASDVDATVAWYQRLLGVAPLLPMVDPSALLPTNAIALDGVQLSFLAPAGPFEPIETDGQAIDHIAFSVPDLDAALEHARTMGAEIMSEPAETALGFRSFFVRGPQQALLELVAAGPVRLP